MELTGQERIAAPRAQVWQALNDPEILKACIPGCESIELTSPTEMQARITLRLGPIKASFSGQVISQQRRSAQRLHDFRRRFGRVGWRRQRQCRRTPGRGRRRQRPHLPHHVAGDRQDRPAGRPTRAIRRPRSWPAISSPRSTTRSSRRLQPARHRSQPLRHSTTLPSSAQLRGAGSSVSRREHRRCWSRSGSPLADLHARRFRRLNRRSTGRSRTINSKVGLFKLRAEWRSGRGLRGSASPARAAI